MEHQNLQEEEEVRRERSGRRSDASMRPSSATDNPRRISTERENIIRRSRPSSPDAGQQDISAPPPDDNMNDDSLNLPSGTQSYSWESHSDSEDRGGGGGSASRSSSRRDRKFDMTTPTLIDEDEGYGMMYEEEEMVSLQRARLLQEQQEGGSSAFRGDELSHRRTPGASMYKSSFQEEQMRRTPGAGDMHRSAVQGPVSSTSTQATAAAVPQEQQQQATGDSSAVLGFGLTLSTPVATGNKPSGSRREHHGDTASWGAQSSAQQQQQQQQQYRPPRTSGIGAQQQSQQLEEQQRQQQQQQQQQQRGEFTFTPWTLSKGPQFEARRPFSPNTLRLTEDLGNLLLEEEDSADQSSQYVFRGFAPPKSSESGTSEGDVNREASAESWTAPYVFKSEDTGDIPSRVPRSSMGRGNRRGRNDGSRRSRAYDRSSARTTTTDEQQQQQRQQVASFLPYAQQPKPVRSMQTTSFGSGGGGGGSGGNPFLSGGFDSSNVGAYTPSDQAEQPSPRFFNVGGAFAPPAKDSSVNFKPPGSAPPGDPETEAGSSGAFFAFPQPSFHPPQAPPQQHLQEDQLGRPPPSAFGGGGAFSGGFQTYSFQPLPPMTGATRESPYQYQFSAPNPSFGNTTVSPSPTLGLSAVGSPHPSVSAASPHPQNPSGSTASPYSHGGGGVTSPYPQHPSGSAMSPYPQHPSGSAMSPYPQHPSGSAMSPYPQHLAGTAASPYLQPPPGVSPYSQHHPHGGVGGGVTSPYAQHPTASAASAYPQQQQQRPPQGGGTTSPYPPHPSGMQANAHEFFPMTAAPPHQQRAPMPPQFSQVPMQFGSAASQATAGWPSGSSGWVGGGYAYVVPQPQPSQQQMEAPIGTSPAPPHIMSPSWPDHGISPGVEYPPHPSPNIFVAAPPTHLEGPHHPIPVAAPTPMFPGVASQGRRDLQQQQQQQQQQRQKGKKGQVRRGSKPGKAEKGKRPDSSASNAPPSQQQQQRKATPVNTSGSAKSKKKQPSKGRDSQTSELTAAGTASACSTPSNAPTPANVPGGDEGHLSASEDPSYTKRSELIESPATRSAFKDFYRKFRSEERSSFQGAEDYAIQSLEDGSLPEKVHWRVYLELADLAKRSNRFADARRLYQQVCQLQPYASQGWLEYSKLEEECGHLNRGARILHAGLIYCEYSENLLTRAIKHEEKLGNLSRARELLARLRHVGIEKVWRTVLEGALLEARAGNVVMGRRVLKYLMHHVPWYGPLYLEAYRLERDLGRTFEAFEVVERGLRAIPRYGPLWFGAFRLCEEIDRSENDYYLTRTMAMIERATESISKELIWKVHLDAAQMLERAALDLREHSDGPEEEVNEDFELTLESCRQRFAMTIFNCPPNLRWKVWLAAGRMEISVGNTERARSLFLRAHKVVPEKGRATTLLECARLEEFAEDPDLASAILCKSRIEYGSDWKVWLESVLLEIRAGNHERATELAKGALEIHPGTGRLWASLVQLRYFEGGEEAQFSTLNRALNAVPKSGEVWCEAGRIHLNPFSKSFNLERARRHLFFATRFTPQYGDSFLETLRLELLEQWVTPIATLIWESTKGHIIDCDKADFNSQLVAYIYNIFSELVIICDSEGTSAESEADTGLIKGIIDEDTAAHIRERLETSYREGSVDVSELELRCANADPNYGLLWFHCRFGPTDTARRILARATEKVVSGLRGFVHFYIATMIRQMAILATIGVSEEAEVDDSKAAELPSLDDEVAWENLIDKKLLAAPSLNNIYMENNGGKGMVFLENTMTASVFATGLVELNRHQPIGDLSLNERRKELFGTDALFS